MPLQLKEAPEPLPDDELILRTIAGDESAYSLLVERYQRKIYRLAYAIVRNDMDADQVTQDTFVQAYMNLSKFEKRSELETWLTRIAINRSRDVLRSRKSSPQSLSHDAGDEASLSYEPVDERPDAERHAFSSQLGRAIEKSLDSLSAQQKTIFRLRHYEDLPLEEIAVMLGLRAGTVRAHLFRAIQKIRKELSGWALDTTPPRGTN